MITYKEKAPSSELGANQKNVYQHYTNNQRQDKPFVCNMCGEKHIIKCTNPQPEPKLYHKECGAELYKTKHFDEYGNPDYYCPKCKGTVSREYSLMDKADRSEFLVKMIFELERRIKELEA